MLCRKKTKEKGTHPGASQGGGQDAAKGSRNNGPKKVPARSTASGAKPQPGKKPGGCEASEGKTAANATPLRVQYPKCVLIKTCEALLVEENGKKHVQILIDEGADTTFITRDAALRCHLPMRRRQMRISGFGATTLTMCSKETSFVLQSMKDSRRNITV